VLGSVTDQVFDDLAQPFGICVDDDRIAGPQLQAWISAYAALLPERRPLAGLDVGSGTGRFTPALARAFGPVTGVEPSVRMREMAQAQSRHPAVRYRHPR
jgi:ubiquinone/menaquinone biosynthesis C-methylase UbiE